MMMFIKLNTFFNHGALGRSHFMHYKQNKILKIRDRLNCNAVSYDALSAFR
jgi:hypothetical protein